MAKQVAIKAKAKAKATVFLSLRYPYSGSPCGISSCCSWSRGVVYNGSSSRRDGVTVENIPVITRHDDDDDERVCFNVALSPKTAKRRYVTN